MRPSQLRSLVRELRAGGVSEFSQETKAGKFSLRLGPAPVVEAKAKAPAKAASAQAKAAQAQQEALARELGVTLEQAREAASILGN